MTLTDFTASLLHRRLADEDTIRRFALECTDIARIGQPLPTIREEWESCWRAWLVERG